MAYMKAVMIGVVTGFAAAVLWVVGNLFGPIAWAMAMSNDGGGIAGGGVSGVSVLIVAGAGFAAGFAWTISGSHKSASY